jgi:SpoVK/Ycf46/Vps4 family AAA+-type ATPase
MSSFLGKTGSNIRAVLEYAKSVASVLLLDEFDSIAKRRDDDGDVGELKRLVTVILQEVDDWPSSSLLIAATNHGDLLDPAIWRRFDDVLEYSAPSEKERGEALLGFFGEDAEKVLPWIPLLVRLWAGKSFSDLNRNIQWIRRRATIAGTTAADVMIDRIASDLAEAPNSDRKAAAGLLKEMGYSDRKISQIVHTSRDTLRKNRADNTMNANPNVED